MTIRNLAVSMLLHKRLQLLETFLPWSLMQIPDESKRI